MRTAFVVLVAAAGLTAAPLDAAAKCAYPSPFIGPVSGSALPPSPTLWVFGRSSIDRVEVWVGGTELSIATSVAWSTEDMTVLEVGVDYSGPESIEVRVFDDSRGGEGWPTTTATYTIDPNWAPPASASAPVTIRAAEQETFQWSCSHKNSVTLNLDTDAPSYRFEWAPTRAMWDAGERTVYTLPQSIMRYFEWATEREVPPPSLELGHVSCFGHTIPPDNANKFERLVYGGVVAQYPDGTETPLPEPIMVPLDYVGEFEQAEQVELPEFDLPPELDRPAMLDQTIVEAPPAPEGEPTRWPLWVALLGGVVAVAFGVRRALVVRARTIG
jgi:hypothetical protein